MKIDIRDIIERHNESQVNCQELKKFCDQQEIEIDHLKSIINNENTVNFPHKSQPQPLSESNIHGN